MSDCYWMVLNESTKHIAARHVTKDGAITAAKHLANVHRGTPFVVLKAIGVAYVQAPEIYQEYWEVLS